MIFLAAITMAVPEGVCYVKMALRLQNCSQAGFLGCFGGPAVCFCWQAWPICLFYSFFTSHGEFCSLHIWEDYKQEMLKFLFTYKACTNRGPDPNPVIITGNLNHQLWKPSCIFQGAQGQICHLQAPCLKIWKIFFMRKKKKQPVFSLISILMVGGFVLFWFFLRATFCLTELVFESYTSPKVMPPLWLETSLCWKDLWSHSFSDSWQCVRELSDPLTLLCCVLLIICLFWWTKRMQNNVGVSFAKKRRERRP